MELPETPHACPVEEITGKLSTGPHGLTEAEAATRLLVCGKNTLSEEKTSKVVIFLRQFKSLLIYILILAAIISLFVADIKDFLVISLLILVNSVIGFWQELRAEASLDALKKMTASRVNNYLSTRPCRLSIIQSTTDVPTNTTEKIIRINRAAVVCIPGGEKTNPVARKSIVTAQTAGTAYGALDQKARISGIKYSSQTGTPSGLLRSRA